MVKGKVKLVKQIFYLVLNKVAGSIVIYQGNYCLERNKNDPVWSKYF